jgi:hypothetical protein
MDHLDEIHARFMADTASESGVAVSELRPQTKFALEATFYWQAGLPMEAAFLKAAATFYAETWASAANHDEAVRRILRLPDAVYWIRYMCRRYGRATGRYLSAEEQRVLRRWGVDIRPRITSRDPN